MGITLMKNVVIFALLCGIANCLMDVVVFNNVIKSRCYNKTGNNKYLLNGQTIPLSSSMETFISLLESFETNFTYSPSQIAEKFLRRFRFDGMMQLMEKDSRDYSFVGSADEEIRKTIIESIIFGSSGMDYSFPEEAFTEDQKCALYYMMSHTIINCTVDDIPTTQTPESSCFIEQGVASLDNHEIHAIAPGRVLLGILASLKGRRDMSIEDVLKGLSYNIDILDTNNKQFLPELIIPAYAVTVGDVVVEEMRRVEDINAAMSRKFGPNGKWNSTVCPTKYYLDAKYKPTKATYAALRGAGDGLLLGLMAKELEKNGHKFTISSLLRMYYSKHGVGVSGNVNKYSYCSRYRHWEHLDADITKQILNYARLSSIKRIVISGGSKTLDQQVGEAMSEFERSRRSIGEIITDSKRCTEFDPTPCEKEADVFVVMDGRENEPDVKNKQKGIVSDLATYLDIRLSGGRMTVMTTFHGYGDRQLEIIVDNTTSKGCIGCLVDWVQPQGRPEDEYYVFESINKTLMNYEKEIETLRGVPVKVLVYFNYAEQPPTINRALKNALWEVHNKHRDVPVFAIGKSDELLKRFASEDDNALSTEESIVETLIEKICESFSTFQYPNCRDRRSSMDDVTYEGYVTPMHTQYWAMYPEYFLKSFNIKFLFSAEGGQITVCYARESRKEKLNRNCLDTTGTGTERSVEFTMSNPCKGKNVYNCKPFYFAIKGKENDIGKACIAKECKYLDQIKFTVRHQGVSCNSSSSLISSLKVVIMLLALFFVVRKHF